MASSGVFGGRIHLNFKFGAVGSTSKNLDFNINVRSCDSAGVALFSNLCMWLGFQQLSKVIKLVIDGLSESRF